MKKIIFQSKITEYYVLTATEPSATEKSIAQGIVDLFKSFGDVEISTQSDLAANNKKIIVGNVSSDKSAKKIRASLSESDYTVRFIDDVLYLIGGSDDATSKAWIYFQLKFMYKDMASLCIDEGFVYNNHTGFAGAITINGNDIKKYKIVHYNSYFAKKCANDIKMAIYNKTGVELEVVDDSAKERTHEILVGKTNRTESQETRNKYDRPHIYYDVAVFDTKLVAMAEGYTTLEMLSVDFEAYLNFSDQIDMIGSIISKNAKHFIDCNMIDNAEDADIRVWLWNMEAPYVHDWNTRGAVYTDDKIRGEVMADVLASYFPDIIGTNEFYNSQIYTSYQNQYSTVMREISDYYAILDDSPYESNKVKERPEPDVKYGIPENILYKKDSQLSLISSCWRYTPSLVSCHGYHQAIFELYNGERFIYSVGHYAISHMDDKYAIAHQHAIKDAQKLNGTTSDLPVILSGDFFTYYGEAGHKVHTDEGYLDAQKYSEINMNGDVGAESYHHVGNRNHKHGCCDFIFHCKRIQSKKFAIIYSVNTDNTSDHYPVCADLKFK